MRKTLPWSYRFRVRSASDSRGWFKVILAGIVFFYVSRNCPMGGMIGVDGDWIGPRFTGISVGFIPLGIKPGQSINSLFKIGRTV